MPDTWYHPSTREERAAETRALIDRVRAEIDPADQADTLRDLAESADGHPQVNAEVLRREARRRG